MSTIKIVLTGPESTGKTSLTKQLAAYFNMPYIGEIARSYVENLDRHYTFDDVVKIAELQIETEKKELEKNPKILFLDTDLIITKYWFSDVYKKVPKWIECELTQNRADFHLLCYPDIPWEYDPTRENPDRLEYFYDLYKAEIERLNIDYKIVTGKGKQRFENALNFVNEKIKKGKNNNPKIDN